MKKVDAPSSKKKKSKRKRLKRRKLPVAVLDVVGVRVEKVVDLFPSLRCKHVRAND
jgi:hypothetical protein